MSGMELYVILSPLGVAAVALIFVLWYVRQ
jgi:hypothetical protein